MTTSNSHPYKDAGTQHQYIILNSHPIQYFAPLYAYLAGRGLNLEVLYCTGETDKQYDTEFGRSLQWDIPLLEGYRYRFLKNRPIQPVTSKKFFSLINPGIISLLFSKKKSTLVIHSWQYATDWLAIIFGKLSGHRIALWTEVNNAHELEQGNIKRLVKWLFFKTFFLLVSEYWCIGSQNRNFYLRLGVSPRRLRSTPYSVDNDRFGSVAASFTKEEARRQLGLAPEAFIILYSGKYTGKKRPMDLLQAFLQAKPAGAILVLVGEGALRLEMEQYISSNGMGTSVILTGFVNQSVIPFYYRAADLFVMCSGVGETWGLSVNEAMNFGLPLLISSLTGCSIDLVEDGENGHRFETGDIASLASRIIQFADLKKEELAAMGACSVNRIQKNSYQTIFEGIIA